MARSFVDLAAYLQTYGVLDFLLPFILVFTIIYAILQNTKILGEKKNFNVVIALVLALLFVVPHVTGSYPLNYDPVQIINESLPSILLVAVAAVMLLLLMGLFGTGFADAAKPLIAILSIIFVVYIFGASLNFWRGPYDIFSWWSSETTELMIIIVIFGLIVYFVTKDEKGKTASDAFKDIGGAVKKLFK